MELLNIPGGAVSKSNHARAQVKKPKGFNVEQLLYPVPIAISIIGELIIYAFRTNDFSINGTVPVPLLRHPESFRTTLVQIINEIYSVFNKAHRNMERIQLQMAKVPGYFQESAEILKSGNQVAIEKMLPRRLNRILEAAVQGEQLSKEVSEGFNQLTEIFQQVLTATLASISFHKQQIEFQIKAAIEEDKQSQISAKKNEYQKIENQLKVEQEIQELIRERTSSLLEMPKLGFGSADISIPIKMASFFIANHVEYHAGKQLEETKEERTKVKEEMRKINEEYEEKLRNVRVDVKSDIYRDKAIDLLTKGLDCLIDLKESWNEMADFFEKVKFVLSETNTLSLTTDLNYTDKESSSIGFVSNAILETKKISCLTLKIAQLYVKVSNRHIACNLVDVQNLVTLKGDQLMEAEQQLMASCRKASNGITEMVRQDGAHLTQRILEE